MQLYSAARIQRALLGAWTLAMHGGEGYWPSSKGMGCSVGVLSSGHRSWLKDKWIGQDEAHKWHRPLVPLQTTSNKELL
jgi:hypothetical protein